MPLTTKRTYKDRKAYMKQYQKQWVAKRRKAFFKHKSCVTCGATNNLELDHVNPEEKVTHNIWSWSEERREKELTKCQVLCVDCHLEKTRKYISKIMRGSKPANRLLTDLQAKNIKKLTNIDRFTLKEISEISGVAYQTVKDISCGRRYINI